MTWAMAELPLATAPSILWTVVLSRSLEFAPRHQRAAGFGFANL